MTGSVATGRNPFADRPPAKKRVITVSLTQSQDEAFDRLKQREGVTTDGAMIKKALEHYLDHVSPEEPR